MKCVKRMDGTVVRVSDRLAHRAVRMGVVDYAPKHEWKATGRKRRR